MAPVEGGAERLLPLGCVAPAAGQELEPVAEPLEQRRRGQELRPRGRELDRERQPVEPPAQLGDGGRVLLAHDEVRVRGLGPFHEELRRLVVGERGHGELALGSHVQRRPARGHEGHAGGGLDEARDRRRSLQHLLEVVDEEKELGGAERLQERLLGILTRVRQVERLEDRLRDEGRVVDRRQLGHARAVSELGRQPAGELEG